jgi:hypothetical protein
LSHRVAGERVSLEGPGSGSLLVTTSRGPTNRKRLGGVEVGVVVQTESPRTTTGLVAVAGAFGTTLVGGQEGSVGSTVPHGLVAVALGSVLDTSKGEAEGLTEVDTGGTGHVGGGEGLQTKSSTTGWLGDTTNLVVAVGDDRLEVGVCRVALGVVGQRWFGTGTDPDGVVTGQSLQWAVETNILVDIEVLRLTSVGSIRVEEGNEWRTVLEDTTDTVVLVASVDGLLEDVGTVVVRGPTVQEVTVHTVTSGVTVGEDPGGTSGAVVGEVLNSVDELVEQGDQSDGVGLWAFTTIDTTRWPGHV